MFYFKFQIQVTDRGIPALSSDKETITVRVLDVNNYVPGFNVTSQNMSVIENQVNVSIGTVRAYDKDVDSLACYTLTCMFN